MNKRTMLYAAKERILAVDSSKFRKTAFAKIGSFSDIDTVVTDKRPDDDWDELFKKQGIACRYPN